MKRIICITLGLLILTGGMLFAQDKYTDFKRTLRDVMEIVETFVDELNAANTGEKVASAIEKYADDMEAIEPRLEEMSEKYPDISDTNYPVELAEVMEDYSELGEKMGEAMSILMQYMQDPAVQEAMEEME